MPRTPYEDTVWVFLSFFCMLLKRNTNAVIFWWVDAQWQALTVTCRPSMTIADWFYYTQITSISISEGQQSLSLNLKGQWELGVIAVAGRVLEPDFGQTLLVLLLHLLFKTCIQLFFNLLVGLVCIAILYKTINVGQLFTTWNHNWSLTYMTPPQWSMLGDWFYSLYIHRVHGWQSCNPPCPPALCVTDVLLLSYTSPQYKDWVFVQMLPEPTDGRRWAVVVLQAILACLPTLERKDLQRQPWKKAGCDIWIRMTPRHGWRWQWLI